MNRQIRDLLADLLQAWAGGYRRDHPNPAHVIHSAIGKFVQSLQALAGIDTIAIMVLVLDNVCRNHALGVTL